MSWRRRLSLLALGLTIAWTFLALLPAPVTFPHPYFTSHPRWGRPGPQVIAHRGGWGLWPEHTLEGYQRAVDLGVDVLDLDVRRSADGVLLVFHDRRLDRVTEGTGPVDDLTFDELRRLDAGYDWSDDGGATHPWRGRGLRIPALSEVLAAFPTQHMVIELKAEDGADTLCGMLRQYHREDLVMVATFSEQAVKEFRQACPRVATSASSAEGVRYWVLHLLRLDLFAAPDFQALQIPPKVGPLTTADARFVRVSQNRGLPVQVWTIDDEDDMKRLIDLGVHSIFTTRPDRLLSLLQARGLR